MKSTLQSINPSNGVLLESHSVDSEAILHEKASLAQQAFASWRKTEPPVRAKLLWSIANKLRRRNEELARLMALEMGKPLTQGRAEIEKCAVGCEFYAEYGEEFITEEIIRTDAHLSKICMQPLGVLLAIMPWNFPFWQVFRCVAPAIMAGNTVLLKHASNVTGCALQIQKLLEEVGAPRGLLQVVLAPSSQMPFLIHHPHVAAVSLTGSTAAGRAVASEAGKALKKCVLELGGSDPYIVLEDADLVLAADICAKARLINSGQSCIAAKRFLVVEKVFQEFETLFLEKMRTKRVGDPFAEDTEVGPMARLDLRDELHEQVSSSVKQGAHLMLGGKVPIGKGAYYPPTVLTHVQPDMVAFQEELFGPVAALSMVKDEAQAIEWANRTTFGLGSAIFTSDTLNGERIATEQLEAGACFVNDLVRSDPRLPFGGIKASGYGRELSRYGMLEFMNVKTVYVA